MRAAAAKRLARRWLEGHEAEIPGFEGAYLTGSVLWMEDRAELPACSDVDLKILVADQEGLSDAGKRSVDGVILDVSYVPGATFRDPDRVLGDYQLAPPFSRDCVLRDPDGLLEPVQRHLRPRFHQREQVLRRCEHARSLLPRWLEGAARAPALHDRVTACQFGAGLHAHLLLTAGCRNPTVRRRYADCGRLLAEHDLLSVHEVLLTLLGSVSLTRADAVDFLCALEPEFDLACRVLRSPYRFAADITPAARVVAIDGAAQMIEEGCHREAMFWILVGFSRCRAVLAADAPEELRRFDAVYGGLLEALGIASEQALKDRARQIEGAMRDVWAAVLTIVETER